MASEPVLRVDDVHTFYGSIEALKGISLEVHEGEIVTLIGANGAGKSTTLRSINGLNHPRNGKIYFQGTDVTTMPPHQIVKRGISQSPEGRKLFPRMTVTENLEMGAFNKRARAGQARALEQVLALFPRLAERRRQLAGSLSGGEQQMLAIGRAWMASPELILLDEPSLGLAPHAVAEVFDAIVELHRRGTSLLVVEQNVAASLRICARGYVLENGRIVLSGSGAALLGDPRVQAAYLGGLG